MSSRRSNKSNEISMIPCKVEAISVKELRHMAGGYTTQCKTRPWSNHFQWGMDLIYPYYHYYYYYSYCYY